jgi:hypothetical protein
MPLREIQSALAKLYTDARWRQQFARDPSATAKRLGLGPEDIAPFLSISHEDVDRYAASLLRKRLTAVRSLLPRTAALLRSDFDDNFRTWAATQPSAGVDHHFRDAFEFAGLMVKAALRKDRFPDWLVDVVRWERALVSLQLPFTGIRGRMLRYDVVSEPTRMDTAPPRRRVLLVTVGLRQYRRFLIRKL